MIKARREELNSINRRGEILEKLEKQAKLFQDSVIRALCDSEEYLAQSFLFKEYVFDVAGRRYRLHVKYLV